MTEWTDAMHDTKSYVRSASLTFGSQLLMVCLGFAANVVIARAIGAEGRGIVSIVHLFPFFLAMVLSLGADNANVYFLGSKKMSHGEAFFNTLLVAIGGTVVCWLVIAVLRNYILANIMRNVSSLYFVFSAIGIPFFLFNRLGTTVFQGHRDFVSFNVCSISVRFFNLVFCAALLLVLHMGLTGGALSVPLGTASVSVVVGFLLIRKGKPSGVMNLDGLRRTLSYGVRAQPGVLMSFFNRRLDVFIINFFLTAADVGLYVIGVSLAELLWNLPNAVGQTLFPKVASSEEKEGKEFTCLVARNSLFLMVVGGICLGLIGRPVILLFFGARFLPSLLPLLVLLPGVVFLGMARVMSSNFHGIGKPQYGTYITLVSVSATIVLDVLLIPRMGIVGAALASSIAYTGGGVVSVAWFMRLSKVKLSEVVLPRWDEVCKYPRLAAKALRRDE